ncbi:MAG: sulfatase-like hydrolase/transferase [Rikenellaceae bacterium]
MNKILTTCVGACLACAPTALMAKKTTPEKPNVIIILVDDLGYGDLGCYGATQIETPNMDKLAKEGRRFTDAHSSSSVSNASRYGLLTGEYPSRANIWKPSPATQTSQIHPDKTTIADVMKASGYSTAAIGKWHLGFQLGKKLDYNKALKPGPLELGFDYYFGVPLVNSGPPFVYVENHGVVGYTPDDPFVYGDKTLKSKTQEFPDKTMGFIGGADAAHMLYRDREVGTTLKEKAVDWIKEHKDNPFFMYYATTNIHHPFTPAERFVGKSKIGMYGDFILELDWIVGEVMQTLEDCGVADNTMVILTSDNGGMFNKGGQEACKAGHFINGDLWGFKFDVWEGGHRVPFIVRYPKKVKAGTISNTLTSNVDFFAMLSSLTGYTMAENDAPDSFDLLPAIFGKENVVIRDHILMSPRQPKHLSIRKDEWVYIPTQGGGGFGGKSVGQHGLGGYATTKLTKRDHSDMKNNAQDPAAPVAQLYNLKSDPYQRKNVYNDYPEVVAKMQKLLEETQGAGKFSRKK